MQTVMLSELINVDIKIKFSYCCVSHGRDVRGGTEAFSDESLVARPETSEGPIW